ncbi:HAMP domain-containing sensor histidine kinase [Desulfoluna sp.]|uniref:sensor histidine kinase n=1 Tax=Desulfoluna sp. TaxID=2045199 RepID=UPI0026181DC5|nr:HAMP domain-containing sensor histidine kinase [Desulfoluna sp.]
MFSKRLEGLKRNTGVKLTFWYALIFILSWLILFAVGFTIINASIRAKDHQIITQMLEKYLVISKTQGVDALMASLKQDQLSHITGSFFVMVKAPDESILYLSLPYGWRAVPTKGIWNRLPFSERAWVTQRTDQALHTDGDIRDDSLEILGRTSKNGFRLQVGYSAQSREEFLEHLRDLFLYIMGPLIALSVFIGSLLARRALKPVRDLTEAVAGVLSGRIDTRVPVHGTENELKILAGQFNTMLDRIEALINGMREALDNAAHDLRTPLMRMRSAIETSVVSEDPDTLREALLDCAEESERISTMLTALMDISEAETGVMKLTCSEFILADLLEEIRDLFFYPAEEKHHGLDTHVPAELIVNADYARLRQVLCNLMDNAIKYTPENGHITLCATQSEAQLTLTITDTGIGIPAHDLPRIFDRLYRSDKSRSQKGLGLGLSLVKAVVNAHNGSIEVNSSPDEGTTFRVNLPNTPKNMPPAARG